MKNFKDYIRLHESLITFGGKTFPKFNNIVIIAGGPASGKSFIRKYLLGLSGKIFDVDQLKDLTLLTIELKNKIKEKFTIDLDNFDFNDAEKVSELHSILRGMKIQDKKIKTFLLNTVGNKNKPNIIFDLTLDSLYSLNTITKLVIPYGYDKKNIHIVWVVKEIKEAIKLNKTRERNIDPDILINKHENVANTFKNILSNKSRFQKWVDGDIWVVFNKTDVDTILKNSGNGGSYIEKALTIKIKEQGKKIKDRKSMDKDFLHKLSKYTKRHF